MTDWQLPRHIARQFAEWSAFYSGDRAALEAAGADTGAQVVQTGRTGFTGIVARVWRRFWGAPVTDATTEPKIKVHVPLAGDIARASADLLFAEPPTIMAGTPSPDDDDDPAVVATTERLESFLDGGLISTLSGAAETCAALGGVFLRATVDATESRVFASRVDADQALPIFRWDRLLSVSFIGVVAREKRTVWRHVETHELQGTIGIVRHQLYQGTETELGLLKPLTDRPELADIAELVTDGDVISTRTDGLDVVYVPNVTPNAVWRTDPAGAKLGAPDIQGSEDLLDRLDHAYSSLLRELDLAKARIVVPEYMLTSQGPGKGQTWDGDREVWSPLNTPPTSNVTPELFQPTIRVDDHLKIMQQLTEDILRRSGYSTTTFGEDEAGAMTATEVNSKASRTRLTRGKKIRHWQPQLLRLLRKMIAMEIAFGYAAGAAPELVSVSWPQPQQAPLELAQMVQAWATAQAVSTEIKVRTIHPDWDDDAVTAEVERIQSELGIGALADPLTLGRPEDAA